MSKKAANASKDSLDAKAEEYRSAITQKLNESGERERLKELLRSKLVECGWRDVMKNHCREIIKQRGLDNVTAEDLVQELTPKGRAEVPSAVKAELLQRIRKYLGTVDTKPEKKQ